MIFIKLVYTSLIKIIIKEENFKWHLEAFASELFISFYSASVFSKSCQLIALCEEQTKNKVIY